MSVEVFVDTNVLYYANTESADPRHALARARLEPLWSEPGRAAVSVQVLQQLHVNLIRKAGLAPVDSAQRVSHYLAWKVIDNDRLLLTAAFDVQARWQLSYLLGQPHRGGGPTRRRSRVVVGRHGRRPALWRSAGVQSVACAVNIHSAVSQLSGAKRAVIPAKAAIPTHCLATPPSGRIDLFNILDTSP